MKQVRVGIGAIVVKDRKVLVGRRKGSHGKGRWAFPGGHLEFGESFEECTEREVAEETGLRIKNIRFGAVTNDIFSRNKHYITIFMICDWRDGIPKVTEPDKSEEWGWFSWDKLPKPLFLTIENLLKQNFIPFS